MSDNTLKLKKKKKEGRKRSTSVAVVTNKYTVIYFKVNQEKKN